MLTHSFTGDYSRFLSVGRKLAHVWSLAKFPSLLGWHIMQKRVVIDCRAFDWKTSVEARLEAGVEVDLIHFNFSLDGRVCIELAKRFGVEFRPSRNPDANEAQFRLPSRS
jgi:hypothetical protein